MTAPDEGTAREIVRRLVEERLLACGNVLPGATSIYRWQGEVQEDRETVVLGKTSSARLSELERRVAELHPYDVPEFVVLRAADVEATYLAWLLEAVRPSAP